MFWATARVAPTGCPGFTTEPGSDGIYVFASFVLVTRIQTLHIRQPVGAALAAALYSQQIQVMMDKHFATKHRLKYNPKHNVLGNRKGCPYIAPYPGWKIISNAMYFHQNQFPLIKLDSNGTFWATARVAPTLHHPWL